MQLPSWTVKKGFFEFNYLDSTLLEINSYFEDISFHKFTVCKEQHLLLGRVLKILRKSIQLKFLPAARACSKNFEKVHSAEIFLKRLQLSFFLVFFSKFSKNLFNRAPVDGCFCIEKTYKTLNTTSKTSVEVYFIRKCEHFSNTDHLHSRYLRAHFKWMVLKFTIIFFTETFSVTVAKKKPLFWQQQSLQNFDEN